MNRMQALATGFGATTLMLIGVTCGSGGGGPASQEPVTTGLSGGASGDTASPILQGSPRASLTYEGAVYYQEGLSSAEAANLEDELELVGSTNESNTLPPGGGESLKIYRLKDDETYQVYTVTPGGSYQNEEDGSTVTIEPEWTRWSASNEAAPVATGMMLPRPNSVGELVGSTQLIVVGTIRIGHRGKVDRRI